MTDKPYRTLRHRDFARLVGSQLLSVTGSQMQNAAINWHVYLLTRSPLALGFVGLTKIVPIIVFSLWGGVIADRRDRRIVMLVAQISMTATALALAVATFTGRDSLWLIYAMSAASSAAGAFDGPARHALLPRLVPAEDLPGALSVNLSSFQMAMIGGPALAGLVIAGSRSQENGLATIYALNAASFLAVILALLTMKVSGAVASPETGPAHPIAALREGLRFVFSTPLIVWTMSLDFFATFFSGAMSLLPIFADQILHVGAKGYGVLAAAPAVGALLGSLYLSIRPLPPAQGRTLLWSVAAYGAATVVFGFSRSFLLTLAALASTGLADAISTVIRQTLRQLATPDALRGRSTSVNMIFFLGGPQLGELEAGLVASLFASAALGVTVSVVSGGLATILITGAIAAWAPMLRDYDFRRHLRT
jgi:MFS family permease